MASDMIQQTDVDEAKKQQQLQQSPQKFDKLGGLAKAFSQGQSAVAGKSVPGAYQVNAQQGVTNAQTQKNQDTTQAGNTIKTNTGASLTPYVVNSAKQDNTFGNNLTSTALQNTGTGQLDALGREVMINPSATDEERGAAAESRINASGAAQTKAIEDARLAANTDLDTKTGALKNGLTTAAQKTG